MGVKIKNQKKLKNKKQNPKIPGPRSHAEFLCLNNSGWPRKGELSFPLPLATSPLARVLARLASLAQIGELARRLKWRVSHIG